MDRPVDLGTELSSLSPRRGSFPWPDHEYVRGWGVFGPPFDTGHVLALRVFPENDFAPYRTVWQRTPDGVWSILVDAPRLDIARPRYSAPACSVTSFAHIEIERSGPMSLRITMTFAVGQAAWKRLDPEEYQRTRVETGRADSIRDSTA
jgi:hypothetical protein